MFLPRNRMFLAVAVLILLALQACNFPNNSPTPTQDPGIVFTVVAQTLEADITQLAVDGSPAQPVPSTLLPEAWTSTPSPTTQTIVLPSNTPVRSPTATSVPCDNVSFVDDLTIDDGTEISAGEPFEKIWRLENAGSCTWGSGYDLVFVSGAQMGAPDEQQLTTGSVEPGQEVDVAVNLVAPDEPGEYRGNFKLRNSAGNVFGAGENSNSFWAEIVVPDESGLRFDFLARADDADWGSGAKPVDFANPGQIDIAYSGSETDANGYVLIKDKVKLESGRTSGKILLTHPKWEEDGYIIGKYPAYRIGPGDTLEGQLGFMALADGSCGAGSVVFEIHYAIEGDLGTRARLGQWSKDCDGKLLSILINLDDLEGDSVHFYLVVLADGPYTEDLAIWSSLGVFR